jgi:hypothetical protein
MDNTTLYDSGTVLPGSLDPSIPVASYLAMEIGLIILKEWMVYPMFAFGFFGNLISLLITTKRENRRITTCIYMTILAIIDNLFLTTWVVNNLLLEKGLGDTIRDRQTFHR